MSETFQETWHRLKELDGESHSCTDIMFCTCRNSKDAKLDGQVQTACETCAFVKTGSGNNYLLLWIEIQAKWEAPEGIGFTDKSKGSNSTTLQCNLLQSAKRFLWE